MTFGGGAEQVDVEYRMYPYSSRQFQLTRVGTYYLLDSEQAKVLLVEFLLWAKGLDILRV